MICNTYSGRNYIPSPSPNTFLQDLLWDIHTRQLIKDLERMLNKLTYHHRTNPWVLSSSCIKSINYSRICNYKMLINCQHNYLTPHLKIVRMVLLSLSLLLLHPDTNCQEVSSQLLSLIKPETLTANRWRGGFNTNQIVVPSQENPHWIENPFTVTLL